MGKILYETSGKTALITMNRPEAMNALDLEAFKMMADALIEFDRDPDLFVAIITGAGDKSFSAGADLKKCARVARKARSQNSGTQHGRIA